MLRHLLSIAAVIGALLTTSLRAQAVDVPVQPNVVSINPFGFLFSWYNAEYEHAFNATTSWAVSAGYISIGDDDDESDYTSAELKFRYYPSAEAPSRFSVGIATGYSHVTDEDTPGGGPVVEKKYDALSVGFELGYSWLMGRTRQFYIGTSLGAKRLFLLGEEDEDDETFGYPTVRLGIGYAF
jgi:hypothetical protein